MVKKHFPILLAFLAILPAHAAKPPVAIQSNPNILIISIDDLRPELNGYGASRIHSPPIRIHPKGLLNSHSILALRSQIRRYAKTGKIVAQELYDHRIDPEENINAVNSPELQDELLYAQDRLHQQWPTE